MRMSSCRRCQRTGCTASMINIFFFFPLLSAPPQVQQRRWCTPEVCGTHPLLFTVYAKRRENRSRGEHVSYLWHTCKGRTLPPHAHIYMYIICTHWLNSMCGSAPPTGRSPSHSFHVSSLLQQFHSSSDPENNNGGTHTVALYGVSWEMLPIHNERDGSGVPWIANPTARATARSFTTRPLVPESPTSKIRKH